MKPLSTVREYVARIRIYTHFFTLETRYAPILKVFYKLVDKYTERVWTESKQRGTFFLAGNVFAGRVNDNREFRAHYTQFAEFMTMLEQHGLANEAIDIQHVEAYEPNKHVYTLDPGKSLYGYQVKAKTFAVTAFNEKPKSALIGMPVGTGKTVTSCSVAVELGVNFCVAVLPKYMEKWGFDLASNLGLKLKDIMLVSGGKYLAGLIDLVMKGGKIPPTIVFSITTLNLFIKAYEESPEDCRKKFGCIPQELWGILKIGLVGIDEVHEHSHEVYTLATHIHGPSLVGLSGTFLSEKTFEQMVQKVLFPMEIRFLDIKMEKYILASQWLYAFPQELFKHIRSKENGRSTYSQNAFEKSIYKNPQLLGLYLNLIKQGIQTEYLDQYREGDRCAIYASTNMMCSIITNAMKKWLGHKFDVRRYIDKDPYENVIEPDIRVTSIIKAGAAIDIPLLRVLFSTISVSSHKAVIQLLGRLRKLKDRDVRAYYLSCTQIEKHMQYAKNCRELLADRVLAMKTVRVDMTQ